MQTKIKTLFLFVVFVWVWPSRAQAPFCVPKTDYDAAITCADEPFIARNAQDLATYAQNYGLENGQYKNLSIRFALSGANVVVHSPCELSLRWGYTHTADNICLDGHAGSTIRANNIFKSKGRVDIVSSRGEVFIGGQTFFKVQNAELSGRNIVLSKGVRGEAKETFKITSSLRDDALSSVEIGRGASFYAPNLEITSSGIIHFGHKTLVDAKEVRLVSSATGFPARIVLSSKVRFKAENIHIDAGNLFSAQNLAMALAESKLFIDAKGCQLAKYTRFQGAFKSGRCLTPSEFNRPPRAKIDASALSGEAPLTVNLDASASNDPDGSIASYLWTFPDGTTSTQSSLNKVFQTAGTQRVLLAVTDDDDAISRKQIFLTVERGAGTPMASFVYSPTQGEAPLTVNFDGSGSSDSDGTIVSYEWIFDDGTTLIGETQQRTFDTAGSYTVILKVTDNAGLSHQTEAQSITVMETNTPPVMVGDQAFQGTQNTPLHFTLNGATDEENDPLTYTLMNAPTSGTLSDCLQGTAGLTCTFTPAMDFIGQVLFSYKANDGHRDSDTVSMVTIDIMRRNTAPVANAGDDLSAISGDLVTLNGENSSDPEGDKLSYAWQIVARPMLSNVRLADADLATPSLIVDRDGTYKVSLTVSDGKLTSTADEVSITVTGEINQAPTLVAITSPQVLQVGTELRFKISGSDKDASDKLSYFARNLPLNAKFSDTTREFRFEPSPSQVGSHKVAFIVTDGKESASQEVTITVQAPAPNQPTTLSSRVLDGTAMDKGLTIPLAGVKVSVEGSSQVAVSDAQGRFTLSNIPAGARIVSLDASGVTAQDGSTYGDFKGRLKIVANVHNRPFRDYMLPRVEAKSMVMIEPDKMAMVQNADIGTSMMIPPNTAMNQDGTMYSGPLSVSMVPVESAPRELPEDLRPNFLITLQPVNIRFANPVPITFPNLDGLPPGAIVALTSLSERGGFEQVGLGQVTEDGSSIQTISGGIRATTWHAPTMITPEGRETMMGDNGSEDANSCSGSIICPSTGILKEEHTLVEFRSLGESVAFKMGYKNIFSLENPLMFRSFTRARPNFPIPDGTMVIPPPPVLGMSIIFRGTESEPVYFSTADAVEGGDFKDFTLATSLNLEGLDTGVYRAISVQTAAGAVATTENPTPSITRSRTPFSVPYISPESEFGRGWMFQDFHRLHGANGRLSATSSQIMLVFGNFNYKVFTRNFDGTYISPDGDYSTLRAFNFPQGGFERITKEGVRYGFNAQGVLQTKVDRYGRETFYIYRDNGQIWYIYHPNERSTFFEHGADGYVDTIRDPLGRITRLEHDDEGYLIKIIGPDATERSFTYASNETMSSQSDRLGRAKSYAYDKRGSVIRTIRQDGTQTKVNSKANQLGDLDKGPLSDPIMALVEEDSMHAITDARGNTSKYQTNEFGAFTREVNAMGGMREFEYDADNNLTKVTNENGDVELENTYNLFGDILTSFRSGIGTIKFEYLANPTDNFHQPIKITDAKGEVTQFEYGRFGNVSKVIYPNGQAIKMTYDRGYLLESVWDEASQTGQFFEYDSNGNQTVIKDRFHQTLLTRTYSSAGQLISETDAEGNTTSYTRNYFNNRLIYLDNAKNYRVAFSYNSKGDITSIRNQRSYDTSFAYDSMDRLIQRTDSLGNSESFVYDEGGNVIERTDRNGQTLRYQYDALNRLTREMDGDGNVLASFEYDAAGNLMLAENAHSKNAFNYDIQGRLSVTSTKGSTSLPSISVFYNYDQNGNISQIGDTEINSSLVRYEYDENDNLVKMGHSSNNDPSYLSFRYDRGQRRIRISYPNGITGSYTYIPGKEGQLKSLSYSKGSQTLSAFNYQYNLNDFVTSVSNQRSGITVNQTQRFIYDKLNQLTSATLPVGIGSDTYIYESTGNRNAITKDRNGTLSTAYSYSDANNRILWDGDFNYTYDKNGNLSKKISQANNQITEYQWDYKNRLIQVLKRASEDTDPTSTITYKYDALDRRIEKNVDGNIVRYVYDRDNIYLEYDEDNFFRAKFVHSNNIDEPVRMERPESPHTNANYSRQEFYFHRDRLGNITEITDFEGAIVQRYVYDAFGNTTIYDKDGSEITPSSTNYLENPYAFTGRELDPETGLYFYRARYYDPNTGKFISEDPIGFEGGDFNLYRYVGNNSLNFVDPFGLQGFCKIDVGIGDFFRNIIDFEKKREEAEENLRNFRKRALCKINPKCNEDDEEGVDPIPDDEVEDLKRELRENS